MLRKKVLIFSGYGIILNSRVTFTSNKSIEVQCLADVHSFLHGPIKSARAVEAFFTFVCFGRDRNILTVPPLEVQLNYTLKKQFLHPLLHT